MIETIMKVFFLCNKLRFITFFFTNVLPFLLNMTSNLLKFLNMILSHQIYELNTNDYLIFPPILPPSPK